MTTTKQKQDPFINWFRRSSPYIHAHRGRTFVISFGGEAVADRHFPNLIHDIALLHGLGIRLILVHGARPQVESRLQALQIEMQYLNGLRVTDDKSLVCVKEAAGTVRVEIEALLSLGLPNSPMAGAKIRVISGNFVTAKPLGILNGVDYGHTGEVRRIDTQALQHSLDAGAIALIPPLGYSPTGEVFNIAAANVASSIAIAIGADKLIFLTEGKGLTNAQGQISNLLPKDVDITLSRRKRLAEDLVQQLTAATHACRSGVKRTHLLPRKLDGGLLKELFTRDGVGTLITAEPYEDTRTARIDDIGGILELLAPLEKDGILVRRSREKLETEIESFTVVERDGMVIACAALFPFPEDSVAELACVAVHSEYRGQDKGDDLLKHMESLATEKNIKRLFVLTTQTAHWFQERGFQDVSLESLPLKRQKLYNYKRNSRVFVKQLDNS